MMMMMVFVWSAALQTEHVDAACIGQYECSTTGCYSAQNILCTAYGLSHACIVDFTSNCVIKVTATVYQASTRCNCIQIYSTYHVTAPNVKEWKHTAPGNIGESIAAYLVGDVTGQT
jgi:hypothetical protein